MFLAPARYSRSTRQLGSDVGNVWLGFSYYCSGTEARGQVREGEGVLLTVVAAGTRKPSFFDPREFAPRCRYQWRLNGQPLVGETYSVLRIPKLSQPGIYRVQVMDEKGETFSRQAKVSIKQESAAPELEVRWDSADPLGKATFVLKGQAGRMYQVESSSNLVDWVPAPCNHGLEWKQKIAW